MKFQFMVTVEVREDSPEAAIARLRRADMECHFGHLLARAIIAHSPGSNSNVEAIDVMDADIHDEVFIRPKSAPASLMPWLTRPWLFDAVRPLDVVLLLFGGLVGSLILGNPLKP